MILETAYPSEKQQPPSGAFAAGSSSQLSREVTTPWTNGDQDVSGLPPPPAYDFSSSHQVSSSRAPHLGHASYFPQQPQGPPNMAFNGSPYSLLGTYPGNMNAGDSFQRSSSSVGYGQAPPQPGAPYTNGIAQPYAQFPQHPQGSGSQNPSQYFAPFSLISVDTKLEHGFPGSKPSSRDQPHPFATHDVKQEEWMRFLREVQEAGRATPTEQIVSGLTSTVGRIPIAGGLLALGLDVANVKNKKSSPVGQVIARWNQEYFHPRMMDVVLARGRTCYTGQTNTVPADMQPHHRGGNHDHDRWSSDDSYSSDDDNMRHRRGDVGIGGALREIRGSRRGMRGEFGMDLGGRGSLRDIRRSEKAYRKTEKRERKMMRKESKRAYLVENEDNWRLVVAFHPRDLV